jgi:hypothetical protein
MSAARSQRLRNLIDLDWWRPRVVAWLILTAALIVLYWVAWFADRSILASDHTAEYIAFEQSFPLADAWLAGVALLAAIKLWRRRESALIWLEVVGGIGLYLFALDLLYDLEHGIYAKSHQGVVELGINLFTVISSIGVMGFGWRFRHELLGSFGDKGSSSDEGNESVARIVRV